MNPACVSSHRGESFTGRLPSALVRRARYAWLRLSGRWNRAPAEAALGWLLRPGDARQPSRRRGQANPTAVAACVETLLACGCPAEAAARARQLIPLATDGNAASPPALEAVSPAWLARALAAVGDRVPKAEVTLERACGHLVDQVRRDRRSAATRADSAEDAADIDLSILDVAAALGTVARRLAREDWARIVREWLTRRQATLQAIRPGLPLGRQIGTARAWMDLDRPAIAAHWMEPAAAAQRHDGSLRHEPGTVGTATVALAATVWYRLGQRRPADRALAYLEACQTRDGGFPARIGRGAAIRDRSAGVWTAKHYLDAALLQVQSAFDAAGGDLPQSIDSADGRVEAVRRWMASLAPDARVADVGCGPGRFLRHLAAEFPQARLTGIDVAARMRRYLPAGVAFVEGSLLRCPVGDGTFDGALAVESLEHALFPQRAVAELCRIVRPGGRVLIIDKRRCRQPLSEYQPWERWFTPRELDDWLARDCHWVTVRPIAHGEGHSEDHGGEGLFLAASGVRR